MQSFYDTFKTRQQSFIHGTIMRTRIAFNEIPCYMHDSACKWFIEKKLKYFEVTWNIFEFSWVWENAESCKITLQISLFELSNDISQLT